MAATVGLGLNHAILDVAYEKKFKQMNFFGCFLDIGSEQQGR